MIVMRNMGFADGRPTYMGQPPPKGQYLKSFDPETGLSEWTRDPSEAEHFETQADAMARWTQVHAKDPVRPWDGKPNRPLTAFTVEMLPLEDAEAGK